MTGPTTIASGFAPPVPDEALWLWDTTQPVPVVTGYPVGVSAQYPSGFAPTKTGLTPIDLQQFVGVPLQYYGNPPTAVDPSVLIGWIRQAEDLIEQETSILLCQTWVASSPELTPQAATSAGLITVNGGGQVRGYDYDLADTAYDFQFPRAQDEGWMYQTLRYRPVQSVTYGVTGSGASAATQGFTAIKSVSYIYPLLNVFYQISPTWFVEDKDFGLVRFVPATNIQTLPLFSMQLAFLGFSENVPGGIHMQYTAGLTQFDYSSRFSFIKQLVLCEASLISLMAIQGSINLGAEQISMSSDGLQYTTKYPATGPFGPIMVSFQKRKDYLLQRAQQLVSGPMGNVL